MANCKSIVTLNSEKFESCGDLGVDVRSLMSTDISTLKSIKDFKDITSSELIDVKGWKTMSNYPTLRLLYERYMNSTSYCETTSSAFDYCEMIKFSELVGTYWVDLIEQVVPATTIWGSTYVYSNTLFDQQKFKYKKSTLFFCNQPMLCGPLPSPTNGCTTANVITTTLDSEIVDPIVSGGTTGGTEDPGGLGPIIGDVPVGRVKENVEVIEGCDTICIKQINCGSEFVGTIRVIGDDNYTPPCYEPPIPLCDGITGATIPPNTGTTTGDTTVTECNLVIDSISSTPLTISGGSSDGTATVTIAGANGPVTYLWSNGGTTPTITNLPAGTYTVTVTDTSVAECTATDTVIIDALPQIQIGDCVHGGFVFYLDGNGGGLVCATNDITGGTSNNHFRWNGVYSPSFFNGVTQTAVGTGLANTNAIIADWTPASDPLYAAQLTIDFVNSATTETCDDGEIHTDWYLPSKDELELMRANLNTAGDLFNDFNFVNESGSPANYWSSTNVNGTWAHYNNVTPWGGPFTIQMNKPQRVRAIRAF